MDIAALYNEHKDLVYNLALQYTQNIEDAEEITQDVFVAAYQNQEKFRKESKPSTWLYRITINKSVDFIRSKKTKKRFAFITNLFYKDSNMPIYDSSSFNHPGLELEHKEAIKNIFDLINALPNNQKTALILSKIEKLPIEEITLIMNLSKKAVESQIHRAKTALQKKIAINE